jgi:hypothetical protein
MFGILGAPEVDWAVTLDGGRLDVSPGGLVRATISVRPHGGLNARRVMAALVGTEEYAYDEVEHEREGSNRGRKWGSSETWRQEVQLQGPGAIGPGEVRSFPVQLAMPVNALPSLESQALRMRWKLTAWIDVGGRDPSFDQAIVVPLTASAVVQPPTQMATPVPPTPVPGSIPLPTGIVPGAFPGTPQANPALAEQFQSVADGRPFVFWAQPAPLRGGAPFSGALDVTSPIDLGSAHLELKFTSATSMSGGLPGATLLGAVGFSSSSQQSVSETQVLWRGSLDETAAVPGWHRYLFAGQLPLAAIVTAAFPHGATTAIFDLTLSRRLRPDAHFIRTVVIVDG